MINPFDLIHIAPNVIPEKDIDFLLKLKNQDSTLATAGKNEDSQTQNTSVRNTLWYPIPPEINFYLKGCISEFFTNFLSHKYNNPIIKQIENVQYLGYPPGGHYIEHNDSEQFVDGKWTRVAPRDISVLAYLSEDYTGGELEFTTLGLTIRPKKGTMILFPSYHGFEHKVHPVKTGFRDSLVTWIETKKRLYETDY